MFAEICTCGNLFLRIAGKIAEIRTRKNFVPHGKMGSMIGHKIGYIWLGALRDQRHIPSKN